MSGHGTLEIVWVVNFSTLGLFVQFLFLVLFEVFSGSAISLQWFLFCVELLCVVIFEVVFYLFFEGCHILCISGCMFFPFLGISYAWSGLSINLAISKKNV
jgi:hypothetical protein